MESTGGRHVWRARARVGCAAARRAVHGFARQIGDAFDRVADVELSTFAALVRFAVAGVAALAAATTDVTASGRASGAALVHAIAASAGVAALATIAATTATIETQHVCKRVAEA